ncbi:MAG: cation-translocating P-type ATPase [Elusimicrobiota bacterium]|nr:MAG: cation-translocating P-type ATPase [Elusimicrobiota bacterium]
MTTNAGPRAWHEMTTAEALERLRSDAARGLDHKEAERRRAEHGPNVLVETGGKGPWRILWEQFTATMVVILLVAAVLSAAIGDYKDAIAIAIIVVLNGLLGFSQEFRAEKAMEALKKLGAPSARVRRGGAEARINAADLVPGDILLLEAGSLVPADGRLLEAAALKMTEAALTGESEAVLKSVGPVEAGADLGNRVNMVYRGTLAANGRGLVVVAETGMRTELGRIATLLEGAGGEPTPLQKRLDELGKRLAYAALGVVAVVFVLGLLRGEALKHMFMTAVSLAAAAIPEGLPAVVTIALAIGARRMLGRKALIRRLPAVETLGSVTVICSDKTGTLTEGRMSVSAVEGPERAVLAAAALCSDAGEKEGDPTEVALVVAAAAKGLAKADLERALPRAGEAPFDSDRKRMTTSHGAAGRPPEGLEPFAGAPGLAFAKGATDALLKVCSAAWKDGQAVPLDDAGRRAIVEADEAMSAKGARVLAVAFRRLDAAPKDADALPLETELVFLGLVGLSDPPRPQARAAVERCKAAGIRVVMITGDHPATARAIAAGVGISAETALTGKEIEAMESGELERRVMETAVYARVAPEHKLKIVRALRARGHSVAMTGDGVNDAPALREADIGVAMGITGTDVSKEAADMILLDDDFATIVAAVEEGRVIYDNVRKFVKYLLTTNSAEVLVMLVAPMLGMPLPLVPLQILWINLITDGPTSLTLAVEPAEEGAMSRPPRRTDESLFARGLGWHAVWVGALMTALTIGSGWWYWRRDMPEWRTMLFTTLAFCQMGHVLAIRSRSAAFTGRGNRLLFGAVAATIGLQLAVVYVPALNRLLSTMPLTAGDLGVAAGAAFVLFAAVEIEKAFKRRAVSAAR